ncbi:EVE domain-containing protein, partial [Methylobacterium organophilum]|nr:EVE domain-containing protein [Methylobacterium organophilum]
MAYWLFKSEPATWSWDQQVAAGEAGTYWNGVRNHLAKKQLMAMQVGERGFFYHSNEGKAVVGIVAVIRGNVSTRRSRSPGRTERRRCCSRYSPICFGSRSHANGSAMSA